ncbi:MAG: sigma-54 dependent transcriptional regulator [Syntrophorhabdaceae bacterium]|nr:sigma-54 dependent transcriptional regulator [Syntrophorhabdaceae bacterium]
MSKKIKILVVDDEEIVRNSLAEWLMEDGHAVGTAENGLKALEMVKEEEWDIAMVDLKMPKMDGLEFMEKAKEISPGLQIIIITAYATVHTAVQAMKMGAYDYLIKPCDPEEISLLVKRLIENQTLVREVDHLRKELTKRYRFHDLVSKSPKMQKIFEFAMTVSKSNSNILILGESGTGKELLARAIHNESYRKEGPFVPVSCVALPETLLESEFFGYEKGAFTNAFNTKKGKFELANGGTIFLDEIGDITPKLQMSLLRVIQEKEIMRLGGITPIKLDIRIIAATNRDLKKAVEEGLFREDLYYRLNVISIEMPPLRERKEDIPYLAEFFIHKFNIEMGKQIKKVSESGLKMLMDYHWPGNVRELENVIERAMVVCKEQTISVEDLNLTQKLSPEGESVKDKSIKAVEKEHILKILRENNWNIQRSAEILDIDRVTLYNKIKKYGLKE